MALFQRKGGFILSERWLFQNGTAAFFAQTMHLNGFLLQRFPPRLIMVIGLVIGAFSMALFVRWPSPWLNLLLNLGIGLCQGAIEVVTDLEVIHMEQKGQSRLIGLRLRS